MTSPLDRLHGLLRRQWRRHVGHDVAPPATSLPFLTAVSDAYGELDAARRLVERALELSSAELHSANSELRGVLQVLPDLIFRVRSSDQLSGVMQGSTATSHPALQSLVAQPSALSDQFRRAVAQVRATRTPVAFEYVRRAEDSDVTYEVRLLPFVDVDIIGIVRDVTEHKQSERDRLILGKLESTGILAGGIAHDFNNLLTSILLNADMAILPETPPDELAEYLTTIRNGVLAARVLTQQLITFARGGTDVRTRVVLTALLHESVPIVLSGSNLRGDLRIADDLWPTDVDAGQIGQVIRNLVLNAREAMPDGGIISLRADNVTLVDANAVGLPPGRYVRLSVADQGHGIRADTIPRIFDPYFSTKMRGPQKGMGLGLTICHSVVQKHGGAITLESTLGVGTTFTVHLPACDEAPDPPALHATRIGTIRRGRILVMDDEPMVLAAFTSVLKQLGYDVGLAPDGRVAVDAYVEAARDGESFDAVILDLTVKGEMGGKDAVRELHAFDPSVRAIVTSGYTDDDVMRQYEQFGFMGCLAKPFDRDALRDVLGGVLAR
ncbi:MAG: hypothetical protein JWL95_1088 [Gemmatimonadetes bacterium]|nr:hypothetical protein [Gemmatimonadota bacterium]